MKYTDENVKKLQCFISNETFETIKKNSSDHDVSLGNYLDKVFSEKVSIDNIPTNLTKCNYSVHKPLLSSAEHCSRSKRKPLWKRIFSNGR